MRQFVCIGAILAVTFLSQPLSAGVIQPFDYFGVYALGDIGTESSRFQATFHGAAGAAGSVHLRSSTIQAAFADGYALHVGGDMSAQYSVTLGGNVDVGGNIEMNGMTVHGHINVGGNIGDFGWSGATIYGSVSAGGTVTFSDRVSVQSTSCAASYVPSVDHDAVSAYFLNTSSSIGSMSATGTLDNQWGNLVFVATSGINIVEVDQETLRNAWGFTLIGPEDAIVLINVPDTTVFLDNTTWMYQGGIAKESVLLNMHSAEDLTLSQTNMVNILAPLAETQLQQGNVDGVLVVGSLYGGGQVMGGSFNADLIPEPTSLSLLALGSVVLLRRRRRMALAA